MTPFPQMIVHSRRSLEAGKVLPCPDGGSLSATMRLLLFTAVLTLVLPSFNHLAVAAEATNAIVVELDRATLIKLPKGRRAIVVEDPLIARATYLSGSDQLIVIGIAFGQTRMTVLGEAGKVVATSTIRVKEPADVGVTVYRGQERGTYYDCVRQCQPRLQLGDASKQFADIAGQIRSREGQPAAPRTESGGGL
jgi:hypothetical protein